LSGYDEKKLFFTIEIVVKSWKNKDEDSAEDWPYSWVLILFSIIIFFFNRQCEFLSLQTYCMTAKNSLRTLTVSNYSNGVQDHLTRAYYATLKVLHCSQG